MFNLTPVENLQAGDRIIGSLADMIVLTVKAPEEWQTVEVTMHHIKDENVLSHRQFMRGSTVKVVSK